MACLAINRHANKNITTPLLSQLTHLLFVIVTLNPSCCNADDNIKTIDQLILEDMLPPSSPKCTRQRLRETSSSDENNPSFSWTLDFKPSKSTWDAQTTSPRMERNLLFQAELRHSSSDASLSPEQWWTGRIGSGGNLYSFVGAYGESVPPQNHEKAPWIDEVWQMISVDNQKNKPSDEGGYFIHQAGTYQHDGKYTNRDPFYSPAVVRPYCDDAGCRFGSWGQQAHIPTKHGSHALYFNRYADCGNGVMEVTSVVHHAATSTKGTKLDYFNIPWGGVRRSSLPEVWLSSPATGDLMRQKPLQMFGTPGEVIPLLKDTGGFTVFSQKMKFPNGTYFQMPSLKSPGQVVFGSGEEDEDDSSDWDGAHQSGNNTSSSQCSSPSHTKQGKKGRNRNRNDDQYNANQPPKERKQETTENQLQIHIARANGCIVDPTLTQKRNKTCLRLPIQPTVTITTGTNYPLYFVNSRTHRKILVSEVATWAWDGRVLFFCPDERGSAAAVAERINKLFRQGDEIRVEPVDTGIDKEESLGLAIVHGVDGNGGVRAKGYYAPARLRFGGTGFVRDYIVFTVNIRATLHPGQTYYNRQYFISDKYTSIAQRASSWVGETHQDLFSEGDLPSSHRIRLYSATSATNDNSFVTAVVVVPAKQKCKGGKGPKRPRLVCAGQSSPKGQATHPLYFITCGSQTAITSNAYHFSPPDDEETVLRSYACQGLSHNVRPTWRLLGFFDEGGCGSLEDVTYDETLCQDDREDGDEGEEEEEESDGVDLREEL